MNKLEEARRLAKEVHAGQQDKLGVPYYAHVLDVAKRVSHLGEAYEIVGLLHDAVEDTDLTLDEIESKFGEAIMQGVAVMTKSEGDDYFEDYLPRVMANELGRAVKLADSSHNLSKAHLLQDDALRSRLEQKYQRVLEALGQNHKRLEPIVFDEAAGYWRSI